MLFPAAAPAQDAAHPSLLLGGVTPGGIRASATESWGTFDVSLSNRTDVDRIARVLVFFESRPDVQYGRDVWVPAHSTVSTWMLAGPARRRPPADGVLVKSLLYDRTDGTDRLILPVGDERIQSKPVIYRAPEATTAILLDEEPLPPSSFGQLPRPESPNDEAVRLAQMFRQAARLPDPDQVGRLPPGPFPPTEQAFDGIDQLVVASNRLADDPVGTRALRHWLEQGGRVWVMLDRVDPDAVAALLGDALDFQLVDRVGLTSFPITTEPTGAWVPPPLQVDEERPVPFARVLLPERERAKHTVNGWPLWFNRQVGRGKVIFTALGPRGWYQRKKPQTAPVPTEPLTAVAAEVQPPAQETAFRLDDLKPLLAENVGYSVVGRWTAALVFGGFLLAALVLGVALRRLRRRELLSWVGPAAALGAAGAFIGLGESSRRSTPPIQATTQIVEAVPATGEAAVHGLMEVYWPDEGAVESGADHGGFYELAASGVQGQTRRFFQTDLDSWRWEEPWPTRDPRFAPFHATVATEEPIKAVGRFGPDGLEGKLSAGPFRGASDAVLAPPNGRSLAVHLDPDGAFHVGGDDVLPNEQYLAGAVLSDRQQKRQEVYRKYLTPPLAGRPEGPDVLLAWAEPIDLHFTPVPDARTAGDALLAVPLQLERSASGAHVTIPGPLLPYRRVVGHGSARPTLEGSADADMELRFQLPATVLPFRIDHARLAAKINAPGRRVVIAGRSDGGLVEVRAADSPLDPIRIDVADERFLHLDADGGWRLNVSLTGPAHGKGARDAAADEKWTIEYLEVEITGTAQ